MASPGPDPSGPDSQPPKYEHDRGTKSKINGHESGDEYKSEPRAEVMVSSPDVQPATKSTSVQASAANPENEDEKPTMNGTVTRDGAPPADTTNTEKNKATTLSAGIKSKNSTAKTSPDPDPLTPEGANMHNEVNESEATATEKKEVTVEIAQTSTDTIEEDTPMAEMHLEEKGLESAGKAVCKAASIQSVEPAKATVADVAMTDAPAEKVSETSQFPDAADVSSPAADLQNQPMSEDELGPAGMSQLAIESTERDSSSAAAPAEISMADAPVAKIARERDEEAAEEPAPKRAKTEPMDDDAPGSTAADADASEEHSTEALVPSQQGHGLDESCLTLLTNWNDDVTNARPLSQFQRREIRKILGRVKKTKSGGHFKDSVQKLWPSLWDQYVEKVESPMDLSELERSLRDQSCSIFTFGEFKANLALLFVNSLAFNGPSHDVTAAAAQIVKTVWEEVLLIPAEEPVKPRAPSKAKPMRESRAVANAEKAPRRQSAGLPANESTETPAAANTPKIPEHPSGDRRDSATTDGGDRPKRTVRAPKPKDIDYSTKPSRKKLKLELQFCDEVLTELMHPKNQHINTWFIAPVDAEGLGIPTYYAIIKKPMDLGKVRHMLGNGDIASLKEFDKSVRQIFENCYKFNGPPSETNPVAISCKELEDLYESHIRNKDAWLSKHTTKPRTATSASNASDDDGEENGDDVGDPVAEKEIEDMRVKLKEESEKLSDALIGGNQNLIDTQRGIVNIIQDKLIEMGHAKQARRKNDRGTKKSGKSGKSRAAGSSGGRRSTGGTLQTKKPGGSKKAGGSNRKLTTSDKDQIATAINDLESPHLEKAIDLIKEDTGQNENNDGELELDIDQLSHDALLKLWELCKKALPGFGKDLVAAPNDASPDVSGSAPGKQASKSATKPRKNKPMSAQEQEAKIAHLKSLRALYRPGQEPTEAQKVTQAPTPMADSSDDSDSEEE